MNIIVYFIAYTMESFALWFYCNFISEQKKKNYINFLYIFLIYFSYIFIIMVIFFFQKCLSESFFIYVNYVPYCPPTLLHIQTPCLFSFFGHFFIHDFK